MSKVPTTAAAKTPDDPHGAIGELGAEFTAETVSVNGSAVHYVRGGQGPALVLLHGFPQDWYEWRRVMPRLSEHFTVLAVDLPGVGGSAPPADGYAAVALARTVRQLVDELGLGPAHLVGHDIGGGVVYAFAREFPALTSTATILEFPIPGIEIPAGIEPDTPPWHVPFHMTPDLPEALVAGRQKVYFRYFFDQFTTRHTAISDADVEHYAAAYRTPGRLRSGFEFFRALPAAAAYNGRHTEPVGVPLLLIGGEHLFGPAMLPTAESLRSAYGWSTVEACSVRDAKHYLAEERPGEVAELIERHALSRH